MASVLHRFTCTSCRRTVEAVQMPNVRSILCPTCRSEIEVNPPKANPVSMGKYKIVSLLGQGGMGQVFLARSPEGAEVALKVMSDDLGDNEELLERFRREASILAGLKHDNIVGVLDHGDANGCLFYIMELIRGESLRARMVRGRLTATEIVHTMSDTLEALGYMHAQGIIHRDIKPENIMIDTAGHIKVTDFGLARASLEAGTPKPALTATNAFLGTENYMSPEQRLDPKRVTHKSDIYALGVVLYELLTGGVLPMGLFQPPSHYQAELDPFWDRLCFRMLDINPDLRPQNCAEILAELANYQLRVGPAAGKQRGAATPKAGVSPQAPAQPAGPPEPLRQGHAPAGDRGAGQAAAPTRRAAPTPAATPGSDAGLMSIEAFERELEKTIQTAHELSQAERWSDALPHWERAREMADGRPEIKNIIAWIDCCKQRMAGGAMATQIVDPNAMSILCPACHHSFAIDKTELNQLGFACRHCGAGLGYDHARHQVRLRDALVPGPNAPASEKPEAGGGRHADPLANASVVDPATEASRFNWTPVFLVAIVVASVDFVYPAALDGAVLWVFKQGIDQMFSGWSPSFVASLLRLTLQLFAVVGLGSLVVRAFLFLQPGRN